MVSLTYEIVAYNTGIQHDLIVGASIFDSSWNFVVDLPWWLIWDVPTNQGYRVAITVDVGLAAGSYIARARAWKNYDLTGASEIGDLNSVGKLYVGGSLFEETPGDGVYLDQMDKSFNVAVGAVSADITELNLTI